MTRILKLALLVVVCGSVVADDLIQSEVSRLRLRPRAAAAAATVTLGDVLDLSACDERLREHLADKPVADAPTQGATLTVTHEQVARRLEALGVNLARVTLDGALRCEVTLAAATAPAPPTATKAAPSPAPAPQPEAALLRDAPGGRGTLAERLRMWIKSDLGDTVGTPEVAFEQGAGELLHLTSPPFEFSIRSTDREKLGQREFSVHVRRDGQLQRTVKVMCQVKLVRQVVVAARPLNRGAFIAPADLRLEARVFERSGDLGVTALEALLGSQVVNFVRAGDAVKTADVKQVDMVTRQQRVQVRGSGNGVALSLTGTALDAGGFGATVKVRLGDARKDQRVVRGVVTDFGAVRLIGE